MTSILFPGGFQHLGPTLKKSHFTLVDSYRHMCNGDGEDADVSDECSMSDFNQEESLSFPERECISFDMDNKSVQMVPVFTSSSPSPSSSSASSTSTPFQSHFLYQANEDYLINNQSPEQQSPLLGNIPFSVYEHTGDAMKEIGGMNDQIIKNDDGAVNASEHVLDTFYKTSLSQPQNNAVSFATTTNTCYNHLSSTAALSYTESTRSRASSFSSTSSSLSLNSSQSVSPRTSPATQFLSTSFSSMPSSPLTQSGGPSSAPKHHSLSIDHSSSQQSQNPKQLFSSPCLTPPPQTNELIRNDVRPNSIRSQSFSSFLTAATSSTLPLSIKFQSSLSLSSPCISHKTVPSNEIISNEIKSQHQTTSTLPSPSFNTYNQTQSDKNSKLFSSQPNELNFLATENLNKSEPYFGNEESEMTQFTDLDNFGEISFYDELTSGLKPPKQDSLQQSPEITPSTFFTPENFSLTMQCVDEMKNDMDRDRQYLKLHHDPNYWSSEDVTKWVKFVCKKQRVPDVSAYLQSCTGRMLRSWNLNMFESQCGPAGSTVFRELDLWDAANNCDDSSSSLSLGDILLAPSLSPTPSFGNNSQDNNMFISQFDEDDDEEGFYSDNEIMNEDVSSTSLTTDEELEMMANKTINKPRIGRGHKKTITLWQFLLQLLVGKEDHSDCIRWLSRDKRIFKIEDSKKVAMLWGRKKNRPAMNYDKLSRSIRQYYKKKIIQKPEQTKRLVYQFCPGII